MHTNTFAHAFAHTFALHPYIIESHTSVHRCIHTYLPGHPRLPAYLLLSLPTYLRTFIHKSIHACSQPNRQTDTHYVIEQAPEGQTGSQKSKTKAPNSELKKR